MPVIQATLDMPPSINHYYRIVQGGKRNGGHVHLALSPEGTAYRYSVWAQLWGQGHEIPLSIPLALTLRFYFVDNRSDLDNRLKACVDALAVALGFNDRRIWSLHAYRAIDKTNPRVEVELNWGIGAI